jgi:hypothetical protein
MESSKHIHKPTLIEEARHAVFLAFTPRMSMAASFAVSMSNRWRGEREEQGVEVRAYG